MPYTCHFPLFEARVSPLWQTLIRRPTWFVASLIDRGDTGGMSTRRSGSLLLLWLGFFFFSKIAQRRRADVYRRGGKTCCKQSPNKESIEHRAGDSSPDRESLKLMGCTWTADRPSFSVITHSGQQRVVQIYSEGSHLTSTSLSIQEEDNKSILLLSGSLKYKS